jgi:hypothetical protein
MVNVGFIMLQRGFIDWEWYTDVNTCKLFVHCLLKVNYSKKKWQGHTINKGEFITSYDKLAIETGLTVSKVRTALVKLIDSKYILVITSTKHTKISIPTLRDFVVDNNRLQNDKPFDKQITKESQTNLKQIATTKTNNNLIINRKKIFREKVFSHTKYNITILEGFFNYWSEINEENEKMRVEKEVFFQIENRLEKWKKNEFKRTFSNTEKELIINR